MRRGGKVPAGVVALLAAGLLAAGCGGDDETATETVTDTVTETVAAPETAETTVPKATTQPRPQGGGETSDLPLCSAGPPPCRDPNGNVVKPPAGSAGASGEAADLPRCSQGPPPCRGAGGKVVEP